MNAALDILAGDELEELMAKKRFKDDRDADEEEIPEDGQYRGQGAYKAHLKKSKDVPKAMRVGPQRGTSTIRTVTIVDYQPDVCKDYKGALLWNILVELRLTVLLRSQRRDIVGLEIRASFFTIVVHVSVTFHDPCNLPSR